MYGIEQVKQVLARVADALANGSARLAELDGLSGDGDLGASMEAASAAVVQAAQAFEGDDIGAMLMKAAMACNKAAPSTMGTLLSGGMMALAKAAKGKTALEDGEVAAMPRLFAEAIMARGKAQRGDKTILDALLPMAEAVEAAFAEQGQLGPAMQAGAQAAREGAQATCGMLAKTGRAHWLGERAREHMDAGAALCALVAEALA